MIIVVVHCCLQLMEVVRPMIIRVQQDPSASDFLCGWSGEGRDMWFKAVVPTSGNLTVEINPAIGSSIGEQIIMELHEGSCGSLSALACSYNKENYNDWNPYPKIELSQRTAGETLYIRVTGWNDQEGEFEICVSDAFGMYPCRIDLVTLGATGVCDEATNSYTQEVTVNYRHDGNSANTINIAHRSFPITGSPQTETLALPATGGQYDVFVALEGDWSNCTANAHYYNGGGINVPDNCYSGIVVNDEPCNAISLNVTQGCEEYIENNIGATLTSGNGVMAYFNCRGAGNAQDVWYKFLMPISGQAVVNTYLVQNYVEAIFELYTGSCGNLTRYEGCLPQESWKGPGSPWHSYHIDDLTGGTEVFVRVADDSGNAQGQFGICVIEPEPFTNDICSSAIPLPINDCDDKIYVMHPATASSNPSPAINCHNQGDPEPSDVWFSVVMPASGSVTITTEEVERGYSNLIMAAYSGTCGALVSIDCDDYNGEHGHPSLAISNRTPNEVIYIRVSEWSDDQRSSFKICTQSVANDACVGALPLDVGACEVYAESGATPSNNPTPGFLCGWDGDAKDVWFSAVVPASGNLTIEINKVEGRPNGMIMELHEGSCGNLTPIACSHQKNNYTQWEGYPKIELEGRTPGETIYIRATSEGHDPMLSFEICVSDEGYNDPCKINFIIPGTQSACDPATNTYVQELEVHYRHDGTVNSINVNEQSFPLENNPQVISVILPAHGDFQNINAQLEGDWSQCTANSNFHFAEAIVTPPNCYSQTVFNDEPCDAIFLTVTKGCVEYIGNNTGATHSMANGINYNLECNWAGSAPQDIWYMFEVPASGNVVVNTYRLDQSVEAVFEVYSGSCDALSYLGGCAGSTHGSLRYDGLTEGDMIYVRVAEQNGDAQGEFGICIIEPEPMTNDICSQAIDVPVTPACDGKIYSMHTATPSGSPTSVHSCEDPNHNPSRDIWFSVTVPAGGIVYISTEQIERNNDNLVMTIYEGDCNALSEIECHHANLPGGQVSTALYNRLPGEVIYVRISQWGSWEEDREYSSFRMCATSADAALDPNANYYESPCFTYRHNTSLNTSWLACSTSPNPNPSRADNGHWLQFDLENPIRPEEIHLWNINHPDHLNDGAKTIAIDYLDGNSEWQELQSVSLSKANASGFYEGEVFELDNSYPSETFLFTLLDNYGGSCIGLSEIKLGYSEGNLTIIEDCPNAIVLSYPIDNVKNFEELVYKTNESISGDITIGSNAKLVLNARKGVSLNPGFIIENTGVLEVYTTGCDEQQGNEGAEGTSGVSYIGAGIMDGFTYTSSSSPEGSAENCINGSGLDAEYMLASRFLAQATLGFDEQHVQDVLQLGYEEWINQQMQAAPSHYLDKTLEAYNYFRQLFLDNTPDPTDSELFAISEANTYRDFYSVWWPVHENNGDLLRQRVALALSEIMVISTQVEAIADDATGAADYYDMLLDHSFSNFRDLIEGVTLHACMGFYLGHLNNPKSDPINNTLPDENFAREIMQLFTIGLFELNPDGTAKVDHDGKLIPTYNNGHIKELAKVFTGFGGSKFGKRHIDSALENGWPLPDPPGFGLDLYTLAGDEPMIMYEEWHEPGQKTIVGNHVIPNGQTGMQDVNMALDILFNHDNVGPFIGKQLIQKLVKSNPSPEYIERITNVFNNNGSGVRGDLGAVIMAILLDEEARSCDQILTPSNGKLREPMVKYLHLTRAMGRNPQVNPDIIYYSADLTFETKQNPLAAPSVFNFFLPNFQPIGPIGSAGLVAPEFQIYDSQTAMGNANLMQGSALWGNVFARPSIFEGDDEWEDRRIALDFSKLTPLRDDEELINFLDRLFTHGRLSDRTRYIIREAIKPMQDWDQMYHLRESMALYLILNSPDYNILK